MFIASKLLQYAHVRIVIQVHWREWITMDYLMTKYTPMQLAIRYTPQLLCIQSVINPSIIHC